MKASLLSVPYKTRHRECTAMFFPWQEETLYDTYQAGLFWRSPKGGSLKASSLPRLALLEPLFHLDEIRFGVAIAPQLVLPARLCDPQPDPGCDGGRRHTEPFGRLGNRVKPLLGHRAPSEPRPSGPACSTFFRPARSPPDLRDVAC